MVFQILGALDSLQKSWPFYLNMYNVHKYVHVQNMYELFLLVIFVEFSVFVKQFKEIKKSRANCHLHGMLEEKKIGSSENLHGDKP